MSDLEEEGFAASDVIVPLGTAIEGLSDKERQAEITKTKVIFELLIKNEAGKEQSWTVDLKNSGTIVKGRLSGVKPDVTVIMSDTFVQLASGKLNGQKAFMSGKVKTRGNMMLATKLESVLKIAQTKQKAKL